ncbi:MAG: hypothetical protein IPI30_14805 [Saprospiraceae bacterium]|nr:hypothetical protein [Candidatus Vicinibacter affinis]
MNIGPSGGHSMGLRWIDANNLMQMNWRWGGSNNGYFNVKQSKSSGTTQS